MILLKQLITIYFPI